MMGRLQLVAIGRLVAGLWLLAVAVVYTDLFALAVAITSIVFGVARLRTARTRQQGRTKLREDPEQRIQ